MDSTIGHKGLHETCILHETCVYMNSTIGCTRDAWPHNFMAGACSSTSTIVSSSSSSSSSSLSHHLARRHLQHGSCAFKRTSRHLFLQESHGCYAVVGACDDCTRLCLSLPQFPTHPTAAPSSSSSSPFLPPPPPLLHSSSSVATLHTTACHHRCFTLLPPWQRCSRSRISEAVDCEAAMSGVSEKNSESSGADTDDGAAHVGVMKRWSWKANDAYFMNIMIKSCIEIIESGKTLSLAQIEAELMDVWHRRLFTLSRTLALFFILI
jgi:hypothetical protein